MDQIVAFDATMNFLRISSLTFHTRNAFRHFEKCTVNLKQVKGPKTFLKKCSKEMVVLKSLKVKLKNDNDAFPEIHRLILEDSLEKVIYEIEEARLKLRRATHLLEAQCHPRQLGGLGVFAKNKARKTGISQTRMHERKLRQICEDRLFERNSLRENIVNRSNRNLSFHESGILGLGCGFNAETNRRDALQIVDLCEYFIKKPEISASDKNAVQGNIRPMLQSLTDYKLVLPERY